jgi:DNA-binding transcriptional LysR family regulator
LNLNHLSQFVAVADAGSLREAATTLGLSQSAITKSLRLLEAELGVSLVERHTRGSTLTIYGQELLSHARLVCNEVKLTRQRLRQMGGEAPDAVHVGSSGGASLDLLPDAISFIRSRYPTVQIVTSVGLPAKLLPKLIEGGLDLVLGPLPTRAIPSSITIDRLFKSRSVVIARKGHPLAGARRFRELAKAPWVLLSELCEEGSPIEQLRVEEGLDPLDVIVRTDDAFLVDRLVCRTDALSTMRLSLLQSAMLSDQLIQIHLEDLNLDDQMVLFTRKQVKLSTIAERFVEIVQMQAKQIEQNLSRDANRE